MKQLLRKLAIAALFTAAISITQAQDKGFVLEGYLKNMRAMPSKIYMVYDSLSPRPMDSALVKGGHYTFKGSLDFPVRVYLSTRVTDRIAYKAGGTPTIATIFLDKGTLTASSIGELAAITVTGSAANKAYHEANRPTDLLMDTVLKSKPLLQAMDQDWLFINAMTGPLLANKDFGRMEKMSFINSHPTESINPYLINELLSAKSPDTNYLNKLDSLYKAMPTEIQNSGAGILVAEQLRNKRKMPAVPD